MPESAPQRGEPERLLIFRVGGRDLAIPIAPIVEIVAYREPTPVPGAGDEVLGLLTFRGRMVTVLDAARRLGIDPAGGARRRVIVLRDGADLAGLAAEAVARVMSVEDGDRRDLPAALRLSRPGLYRGLLLGRDGGCVLWLDLERFLGEPA